MNFTLSTLLCVFLLLFSPVSDAERAPNSEVRRVQTMLTTLGYDPGETDGVMGVNTRHAIKEFQRDYDLEGNGAITDALIAALKVAHRAAAQEITEKKAEELDPEEISARLEKMNRSELIDYLERVDPQSVEPLMNLLGERAKDLPARLLFRSVISEAVGEKTVDMALKGLFYPATKEGREQFQRDLGADVTGELTVGQVFELQRRHEHFRTTPVYASNWPGAIELRWHDGTVVAEGTWVLENRQIGFPVNKAKIICTKSEEVCRVIQAHLEIPNIEDPEQPTYLDVSQDEYEVISWKEGTILAQGEFQCLTLTLQIDRERKDVR